MSEAVIVADSGYKGIILVGNYILGNNFLNALCFKIEFWRLVPDIVSGEDTIA